MRKIASVFGIAALAVVVFSTLPTAALGFHVGPFYFHLPFGGRHYHRHHVYARINPNEARTRANDVARGGGNTEALESCTGPGPGVTDLPVDQIRQAVHPTPNQEAALESLRAALSRGSDIIKSACPTTMPLTPIGRLDSADRQLDATIKAIQIVRSPLERFYEGLADEQRARFNRINGSAEGARPSDMAALCSQLAGSLIDLPTQRIEQVVRPTVQQQSALEDLKKATQDAGNQMQSSCPTAAPKSPVARLDTVETGLTAVLDAIKAVRPELENFYASLNDDQKARFNTMGPPPTASSSTPRQNQR
jgi:LTXXQ motif family protein